MKNRSEFTPFNAVGQGRFSVFGKDIIVPKKRIFIHWMKRWMLWVVCQKILRFWVVFRYTS
jgi:hypothetical protein